MLEIMPGEMTRMEMGLVDMTRPDKPRSSKQRYRLTNKGRSVLDSRKDQT